MSASIFEQVDEIVAEAAAPARRHIATRALGWLSEVADQPQLISICAGTVLIGLAGRNRRLMRAGARMFLAELLDTGMKSAVKHHVDRTRPRVVDDGGAYAMHGGDSDESALNSFPSGHTAGAVTVARALAREYSKLRGAVYGTAAAVARIQVPRCQHYPTDLAAGAVIRLFAEQIVNEAVGWSQSMRPQS